MQRITKVNNMMDGTDISGFGPQDPNAQSANIDSVEQAPPPASALPVEENRSTSTLQKSELELAELLLAAQYPGLIPPNILAADLADIQASGNSAAIGVIAANATAIQIAMKADQVKNDIISSMWDNFSKGIQEMEERAKRDDIQRWTQDVSRAGPKSSSEYYAFLLALSATERADELNDPSNPNQSALAVQFNNAFNQWMIIPSNESNVAINGPSGSYPDSSFIAGCVACNADLVRDAIGAVGLGVGYQLSVNPIADAVTAVGPNSGLPVDSQAAGALIAALLYGGAANKATIETLEEAARSGKPPQDLEFALNYAQNILAIVSHNIEKGAVTVSKEQHGQNQMIRLMLSVMALNLVYRAAFGGMEGQKEFTDLLKEGGTSDIDPAIKPTIDRLIAQIKTFLPSDEPSRSQTIASLSEYIDSKDSVDSLLATTRMFTASLGVKPDILQKRLEGTIS